MSAHRYDYLDGMRGAAALMVMARHTSMFTHIELFRSYLAVDLFFELSGFVIASAYGGRMTRGELGAGGFMLIRLIRLYPMYFLSALLSITVSLGIFASQAAPIAHQYGVLSRLCISTLIMLPAVQPGSPLLFPFNGVFWSLFYEVLVNAIYAITSPRLCGWHLQVMLLLVGLPMIALGLSQNSLDLGAHWGWKGESLGLLRALFGIFLGIMLQQIGPGLRVTLRIPSMPWLGLLLATCLLASPSAGAWDGAIDLAVAMVLFPLAILLAAYGQAIRARALLAAAGRASYPIYVLHLPIARLVLGLVPATMAAWAPWGGAGFLVLLTLLALFCEVVYEAPLRRWLSHRLRPSPG